jgi:mono/diheme cytochrome c family protein
MTWIVRLTGPTAAFLSVLVCGQALAQERSNPQAGHALARRICSECHAVEARQARSPNRAAPTFKTIADVPGMSPIALSVALQRSHENMPNIILDEKDLRDVVAYILSLR